VTKKEAIREIGNIAKQVTGLYHGPGIVEDCLDIVMEIDDDRERSNAMIEFMRKQRDATFMKPHVSAFHDGVSWACSNFLFNFEDYRVDQLWLKGWDYDV